MRIIDDRATLAVKTKRVAGVREEFEYDIPMTDATSLMACCGGNVTVKTRHYVQHAGLMWEIDEYDGLLTGVVLAEVELSAADQQIDLLEWIGAEVKLDVPYRKINMLRARRVFRKKSEWRVMNPSCEIRPGGQPGGSASSLPNC